MPPERSGFVVVMEGTRTPVLAGIPTLGADEYLEGLGDALSADTVVVNLCRSYQYLSKGYYVSLLADARRQRVFPSLRTIEQARHATTGLRALREVGLPVADARTVRELRRNLARGLSATPSERRTEEVFALTANTQGPRLGAAPRETAAPGNGAANTDLPESGYAEAWSVFGQTVGDRFQSQCAAIFAVHPFPLLKVRFYLHEDEWKVGQLNPMSVAQLDPAELTLLERELARPRFLDPLPAPAAGHLRRVACLWDPDDRFAASDRETLARFAAAAPRHGLLFERIGCDDLSRLAEFDALFIRTVTAIDHYSFAFAQAAESLGIPVIDDPQSILRCTNKVYMHEAFQRDGIASPRTAIISRRSSFEAAGRIGFPLIVKMPDGTFSQSVKKADNEAEFDAITQEMFRRSPLLVIQEFLPTAFDWRIGVLAGQPLFACKYHMAEGHWQIAKMTRDGESEYGHVEALEISAVPAAVLALALRSAEVIGDGLYGVDLKETPAGPVVIEINDNPNLQVGYEDGVEGERVYDAILAAFAARIRSRAGAREHA